MSAFTIKTEVYEGPLDLLLALIEKRRLSISDISLASVADDFINYLNTHKEFPMAETAHFILVASTLLLIKSKSLLPTLSLTPEEEASMEELERRIQLYKYCKEVGDTLRRQFGRVVLFSRDTNRRSEEVVFSPHEGLTVSNVFTSIDRLLNEAPSEAPLPKAVVKQVMSLEEMITTLASRIGETMKLSFSEFSGMGKAERVHVIVGFLAMLELVKQGVIAVEQDGRFSDIIMETDQVGTPRYF